MSKAGRNTCLAVMLVAVFSAALVLMWNGTTFWLGSEAAAYMADAANGVSFMEVAQQAAGAYGWREVLRSVLPAVLAGTLGEVGLVSLTLLAAGGTIVLVYLIGLDEFGPQTALVAALLFALSPLILRHPFAALSPLGPGVLTLLAVYLAQRASQAIDRKRLVLWVGCVLVCAANFVLTPYAIWLPVFIGLYYLARSVRTRTLVFLAGLVLAGFHHGWPGLHNQPLSFYDPATPVRELLEQPAAQQVGNAVTHPQYPFTLPGNTPAILLALGSVVLASEHKRKLGFVGLWLLALVTFNFGFLQANIDTVLVAALLPLALLVAMFFERMRLSPLVIALYAGVFLLAAVVLRAEALPALFVIDFKGGWATQVPWHDLSRVAGGLVVLLAVSYLGFEARMNARWQNMYLHLLFGLLGITQVGLMSFLRLGL